MGLVTTTNIIFSTIGFALSLVAIILRIKGKGVFPYAKLVPILYCIIFFLIQKDFFSSFSKYHFFLFGLASSLMGDFFLLNDNRFNLGLFFFLICHLLYSFFFFTFGVIEFQWILICPPIVVFSTLTLIKFKTNISFKKLIQLYIYSFFLCLMNISALNFFLHGDNVPIFIPIGAILFLLSDCVLAINKFYLSKTILHVILLVLYYAAQSLLLLGVYNLHIANF